MPATTNTTIGKHISTISHHGSIHLAFFFCFSQEIRKEEKKIGENKPEIREEEGDLVDGRRHRGRMPSPEVRKWGLRALLERKTP
ncbi:hypothetical protein U1Q18_040862 [Sarracenia purpurea var. burkii]